MTQNNKRCGNCGNFRAYFTRGYCSLTRENNGYCCRHEKITDRTDSCDEWRHRHTSAVKRIAIAVKAIPDIYGKIAVIEQILKEELGLHNSMNKTDES